MTTPERDELLRRIEGLTDDEVRDLLVLVRDREPEKPRRGTFAWAGILHEAPDSALHAKETMRSERGSAQ